MGQTAGSQRLLFAHAGLKLCSTHEKPPEKLAGKSPQDVQGKKNAQKHMRLCLRIMDNILLKRILDN